ncbi:MAG: DUF6036 family nucleotidyltransferase [Candidatus Rifleibacteriota bacterium]
MKKLNQVNLDSILTQLNDLISLETENRFELIVCGGSALIALGLVNRATKDVDIVARIENGKIIDPEPLPEELVKNAAKLASFSELPPDWLNTGPADLFRMGLPEGFAQRLVTRVIGPNLILHYISRIDQIHFKLYAAVDRGGYHITDLLAVSPADEELMRAAKWSLTHDVSSGFREMLEFLLRELGYEHIISDL